MMGPPLARPLPPLPEGAVARARSRAEDIRAVMASVPAFSSKPPGMTMTDSALSASTRSASTAGAEEAGTTMMKRSTFSGREATSGTQRQPSISAASGLTM